MFGITTHKQIPDEYLVSYFHWDTYMATVWAELLINHSFESDMTIIEIAPGTSIKIGLALKKCQFRGKLYIVEPSKDALSTLVNNYEALLPNAEIHPICHTLLSSLNELPRHADFILANHPLDDMLIANRLDETSHPSSLFDWTLSPSGNLSSLFLEAWTQWISDERSLHSAKIAIVQQWMQLIDEIQPNITIISQYPSATLQKNQLHDLNLHANDILHSLKTTPSLNEKTLDSYKYLQSILNQLENYNDQHIGNEVLNSKNWLIKIR